MSAQQTVLSLKLCVVAGVGITKVSLQQGENPGLLCTSNEGAIIECSSKSSGEGGKTTFVRCTTPGGIAVELAADGQVTSDLCRLCVMLCMGKVTIYDHIKLLTHYMLPTVAIKPMLKASGMCQEI